jgi:ADP-ribose pyrophosphatase YjhB (NUDIX family)
VNDPRTYPQRPILAVSAAIIRDGKVLIVKRARSPAKDIYTLPGGVVEAGESLTEALIREVHEETSLTILPVALAGHREVIARDNADKVERHFVILCFAARWISGDPAPSDEIAEARWRNPAELKSLRTTEGLAEIVAEAFARIAATNA